MPFYKEVATVAHEARVRIVAISGEPLDLNRSYLQTNGITVEQSISQGDSGVQIAKIPSIILVKNNGTVIDSWTGLADEKVQTAAVKAIRRL